MRRLADYYLNKTPTLDEMKTHRKFIRDYNCQIHHDMSLERQLLHQRITFFLGSVAMKSRIEKRAVPVALGSTRDQTESGDLRD